jgi:CheY-like chemotaxis protein
MLAAAADGRAQGTTFKIYLPRVEAVARKVQPTPTVTSVRGTETLLIVEDEEAVRGLAQRILQVPGYTVLTASNGGEALFVVESPDDLPPLIARQVADPDVRSITHHLILVDATSRHDFDVIRSSRVAELVGELRHRQPERASVKTAVVALRPLDFGLACSFEAFADVVKLPPVFAHVDAACAWLGIRGPGGAVDRGRPDALFDRWRLRGLSRPQMEEPSGGEPLRVGASTLSAEKPDWDAALAAYYAEDAESMMPNMPAAEGRACIKAMFSKAK